jgi:hypothetical protein
MEPPPLDERYTERTCSLCGCQHRDSTPSYCRTCHNQYYAWRYHQKRKGLPTTVVEYRRVTGKVQEPTVESVRLKECPICFNLHRNPNSGYCSRCKASYQAWATGQRETHAMSGGRVGSAHPTVEEFRNLVFDIGQR